MSWTASHFLDKSNLFQVETPDQVKDNPENLEQWGEAITAAQDIIESGVLGDINEHKFNVHITGHSNPDHKPADGWANDHIGITISQAVA